VTQTTPPATTSTGSNVTFNFTIGGNQYQAQVAAPDPTTGEYGLIITQAGNTVVSLIYKDDTDWAISFDLPSSVKVDDNLTINAMNISIAHGTVTPIGTTTT
jgi:hypothetical protein